MPTDVFGTEKMPFVFKAIQDYFFLFSKFKCMGLSHILSALVMVH